HDVLDRARAPRDEHVERERVRRDIHDDAVVAEDRLVQSLAPPYCRLRLELRTHLHAALRSRHGCVPVAARCNEHCRYADADRQLSHHRTTMSCVTAWLNVYRKR